jgi:hypothetical protein
MAMQIERKRESRSMGGYGAREIVLASEEGERDGCGPGDDGGYAREKREEVSVGKRRKKEKEKKID